MANRTAILIDKNLSIGAALNATAIVAGQLAANPVNEMYASIGINDLDGNLNAAILDNVVILKATSSVQLTNYLSSLNVKNSDVQISVFTNWGRTVSNGYDAYSHRIANAETKDLEPIAVALFGEDALVKSLTKKFSYYR